MKDPFDLIFEEIKRQFKLVLKFDESTDTKIGIFLGFIFLVITQLLTYENLNETFLSTNLSSSLFFTSFIFIVYSLIEGMKSFFIRKYLIGIRINTLIELYSENANRNFKQIIARKILDDKEYNSSQNKRKTDNMRRMIVSFIIGMLLIILSRLISILCLEVAIFGR